jgi:hypothetical protein
MKSQQCRNETDHSWALNVLENNDVIEFCKKCYKTITHSEKNIKHLDLRKE